MHPRISAVAVDGKKVIRVAVSVAMATAAVQAMSRAASASTVSVGPADVTDAVRSKVDAAMARPEVRLGLRRPIERIAHSYMKHDGGFVLAQNSDQMDFGGSAGDWTRYPNPGDDSYIDRSYHNCYSNCYGNCYSAH